MPDSTRNNTDQPGRSQVAGGPAEAVAPAGAVAPGGFDRPLLLTPGQDMLGWLGRRVSLALLQFVAFTCLLSVLFIFVFIL